MLKRNAVLHRHRLYIQVMIGQIVWWCMTTNALFCMVKDENGISWFAIFLD